MTALPTDLIDVRKDARAVDEPTVSGLAESIAAVGLINPIRVRAHGDRWEVITGVHRLMAFRQLGLVEIECSVVTDDDLHAELAMIDENLCRAELSPSDRAKQTARRKAIYLELHPETGRGGDRKSIKVESQEFDRPDSFVTHTAAATGRSAPAVYLDVQRGEKVIDEVINLIRGTKLDTGTYLDKLKRLTPNDQHRSATRDLAQMRSREREAASNAMSRRFRAAPVSEEDAKENQIAALMVAWNKAGKDARAEFLARIATPAESEAA